MQKKIKRVMSAILITTLMITQLVCLTSMLTASAEGAIPVITVDTYTNRETLTSPQTAAEYLYAPDPDSISDITAPFEPVTDELLGDGIGDILINSFVQGNLTLTSDSKSYDALRSLATKTAGDDVYVTVLNRDLTNDITAAINLVGYTISADAEISTLELGGEIEYKTAALGVGEIATGNATFAWTFPAGGAVTIKLSGAVDTSEELGGNAKRFGPWQEQYQVRHVNTPNIGSVPAWILVGTPLGTSIASIQNDPSPVVRPNINSGPRAFYMERNSNDIDLKISLRTQDFNSGNLPANFTKYDGFIKVVFDIKAGQDDGDAKLTYQIKSGDTVVFDLVLQNGTASCNGVGRFEYEKDTWYQVEVLMNHDAGEYAVYMEGNCLYNRNDYNNAVNPATDLLECMYFTVDSAEGNFWFDNIRVLKADTTINANYSDVEDAIAAIPADFYDEATYSKDSTAELQAALDAVREGLIVVQQEIVDGYAEAILLATARLVPTELALEISNEGISSGAGPHNITWSAKLSIDSNEETDFTDFNNSDVKIKSYGVFYGTSAEYALDAAQSVKAGESFDNTYARQHVFASADDLGTESIDIYRTYGFRLTGVGAGKTRANIFYIEYELNGHTHYSFSNTDETIAQ